jgi:hypothetical protein
MALLYKATLTPSKLELLQTWTPRQPWTGGTETTTLEAVGAYRFDDPEGEVGMETHLLRTADGQILQVPVTYRGAPLTGSESFLIGTTQHSVLGQRWVYDACGDAVYVGALATAILRGGTQAELEIVTDAGKERRQSTTQVSGSGSPAAAVPPMASVSSSNEGTTTVISADSLELTLVRVIDLAGGGMPGGGQTLVGTWPGHDAPALLALAHVA